MCWILFSVGAEYLAKGVCLSQCIEIKEPKKGILNPPSPNQAIDEWARKVEKGKGPRTQSDQYKTMGKLTQGNPSPLGYLVDKSNRPDRDRTLLIAAYKFLASAVRNRDAHYYAKDVRDADFRLVGLLFVPAFNILLDCLPEGDPILCELLSNESS